MRYQPFWDTKKQRPDGRTSFKRTFGSTFTFVTFLRRCCNKSGMMYMGCTWNVGEFDINLKSYKGLRNEEVYDIFAHTFHFIQKNETGRQASRYSVGLVKNCNLNQRFVWQNDTKNIHFDDFENTNMEKTILSSPNYFLAWPLVTISRDLPSSQTQNRQPQPFLWSKKKVGSRLPKPPGKKNGVLLTFSFAFAFTFSFTLPFSLATSTRATFKAIMTFFYWLAQKDVCNGSISI